MADADKPQKDKDARGWSEDRVGNDATMKEPSHKEYEAHDTTPPPSDPGPGGGKPPPAGTGESSTRRGEDVHAEDGKEFEDHGKNQAGRPYGNNEKDEIGVADGDTVSDDMQKLQHP